MRVLSAIGKGLVVCAILWPIRVAATVALPVGPAAGLTAGAPQAVPYSPPLEQKAPPAPPASPVAAGLALVLPAVAGGYLATALLRARRMACPPCPSCGSRRGAVVGPVGQYHNCCRCHDCGYLWEKDPAAMSRSVAAPTPHPPGELH